VDVQLGDWEAEIGGSRLHLLRVINKDNMDSQGACALGFLDNPGKAA